MADIMAITSALNVLFFGILFDASSRMPGGQMVKRATAVAMAMLALNAVALSVALGLAR